MIEPTRMAVFETCPSQTMNPEKVEFSSKTSWKSGNFSQFYLGKVEILGVKSLEKWKFLAKTSWKSGVFSRFYLEKVEILGLKSLEKWKF